MRQVGIAGIAAALPDRRLPLSELLADGSLASTERDLVRSFGIQSVAVATESAHDLALAAARALLAELGMEPSALDAVVHVPSRVPERLMSSETTRLQHELGASRAVALSTGDLGCTSSTAALYLAESLIKSTAGWHNVLVAHGSRSATQGRVRLPVTVNGDAGIAFLVSDGQTRLAMEGIELRTDGRYWDLFSVDYLERPRADWTEACSDPQRYSFHLGLDSRNALGAMVDSLLAASDTKLDQATVVMQNLSLAAFTFYEQALGTAISDVCRTNLRHLGHLGGADVFVNLVPLMDQAARGDLLIALNNSPSAAWSACALRVVS